MPTNRILAMHPSTKAVAYKGALMLQVMQNFASKSIMDIEMSRDGWELDSSFARLSYYGDTNAYCARSGTKTFLFLGPIKSESQARSIWSGYLDRLAVNADRTPFNPFFTTQASIIYNSLVTPCWNGGDLYIFGHSAGGAIGCHIGTQAVRDLPQAPFPYLLSYGAPKVSSAPSGSNFINRYVFRWFNSDDPVPLIPYDPGFFSWNQFWRGQNEVQRLASFAHPSDGQQISQNGVITRATIPQVAGADQQASVQSWLASLSTRQDTSHSISAYVTRLNTPLENLPALERPTLPVPVAAAEAITNSEIQREERVFINTMVSSARHNSQQPLNVPDDRLFKAYRKGRLWVVYFGDTEISFSARKKRARGLARIGNDFLRRLQRQEVVSAGNVAAKWVEYLAFASDPTTGFTPQLNTQFPARP